MKRFQLTYSKQNGSTTKFIFFVKQTQHIYITFLLYKLAYGTSKKQATLEEQQTLKINYFQIMVRSRWQVPSGNNFKPVRSLLKEKLFN